VKTLVFDCDGRLLVALVPGHRRADRAKIAAAADCRRAEIVGSGDLERLTGFPPGAVAPFPLPPDTRALIDHSLLVHSTVWIGAGSTRHLAALAPVELVRLTRGEAVDITADG
jgi:Cys-tRNA(Pro)/Cys-tRNA(Cys) deacylase